MAYVLAVLASLGVALTVTPALSLILLGREKKDRGEPPLTRFLKRGYHVVLPRIVARPRWAVAVLLAVFLATGVAFPVSRRSLPARVQGDGLPDALGRQARNVARGDDAHHDSGEQGTADDSRCAQLRVAHRSGGGRRRGRRTELCRIVDQHRSRGGLRRHGPRDPDDGGRLPRALSRRADLSARAHQRGPDGSERKRRRSPVRAGPRRPADEGGRDQVGHRRRRGRDEPQGGATGPRPADRSAAETGRGAPVRPDSGRRPAAGNDACEGHEGRRALRRTADPRRGGLGCREHAATTSNRCATSASTRHRAATFRSAT